MKGRSARPRPVRLDRSRPLPVVHRAASVLTTLASALLVLLSACAAPGATRFPSIVDENPQITLPGGASTTPTPQPGASSLRIGIPAGSPEMLSALAELYVGLRDGALVEADEPGSVGATISLEDLAKFEGRLSVSLVDLPTGDTLESTLLGMGASGTLPDVFLTGALPALARAGYTAPLDGWPSLESLLQDGKVLPNALQSCVVDGRIQGIPYSASTPVLFYNAALVAEAGIDTKMLEAGLPLKDLVALFPVLTKTTAHQYALYDAVRLLPLLPSTRDASLGWSGFSNGSFDFSSSAFADSVSSLRAVVKGQWTLNHLNKDQLAKYYATSDPRILGKVAFWVDDSSNLSYWTGLAGLTTGVAPLPYLDRRTLPLTVRCFAVNHDAQFLEESIRFAGFLATDADSLRLQSRFGSEPGRIPLQLDATVWADWVGDTASAGFFPKLRDLLSDAYVDGHLGVPGWSDAIAASLDVHALRLLQGLESIQAVSSDMDASSGEALAKAAMETKGDTR